MFENCTKWKEGAVERGVWIDEGKDLKKFVDTCVAIVSMCKDVVVDMSERCSQGRSFHQFGSKSLFKRANMGL